MKQTTEEQRMDAALHLRLYSYRYTCIMLAAEQIGLFEDLQEKTTLEAIAKKRGYATEPLQRLLYGLECCGLAYRDGSGWELTYHGHRLVDSPLAYREQMREIIRTQDAWFELADAVLSYQPSPTFEGGKSIWEIRSAKPQLLADFQAIMVANAAPAARQLLEGDWLPDTGIIADVGGGMGAVLERVLVERPKLEGVLLELKEVIGLLIERGRPPELFDRLHLMFWDFFHWQEDEDAWTSDVSLLINVIHDWDDAAAVHILKQCAKASPKVLVVERLLIPGREFQLALVDLHMLAVTGGKQRTAAEFEVLFAQAGLRTKKSHISDSGFSVLEAERCPTQT